MAFLFKCKHGDQCDSCRECDAEQGVHDAIKELRATGNDMIGVEDAIGIIEGCIKANNEKLQKIESKRRAREHDEEMERLTSALMPDPEEED